MTQSASSQPPGVLSDCNFTQSVRDCLEQLQAAGSWILCLGQTVFWDEVVKAVALAACAQHAPDLHFVAAIHDTDYFSKLPRGDRTDEGFSLQPRDDSATRELWAAVAETSALFGAEVPVPQSVLRRAGVPLRGLARRHPGGPAAFLHEATAAYGWRGVANHHPDLSVACDVDGHDVCRPLSELLHWAFDTTEQVLAEPQAREHLRRFADALLGSLKGCKAALQSHGLTELYTRLLRLFYNMLLGEELPQLHVSASTDLFCFNLQTCDLPRFDLLDLFLDPATRHDASAAYNEAVEHSGIYTLDRFGEGAIPFDLVVCGQGRGTLRVLGRRAVVELPRGAVVLDASRDLTDRRALAELVSEAFQRTCLVGKALILPLMVSREATLLLHEGGSVYLPVTHRLVRLLRERGMDLSLNPLLRLKHETWDSLSAVEVQFLLPPHLARFFGRSRVSSAEFAAEWRSAVDRAQRLLADIPHAASHESLLCLLARYGLDVADTAERLRDLIVRRRASAETLRRVLEQKKQLWRQIKSLQRPDASPEQQQRLRELKARYRELGRAARGLARSPEHQTLQAQYADLIWQIEALRQQVVSDAVRTTGLTMANNRPSWWWFPAVDPTGRWLRRLAETAEMRFEPFGEGPED